MNTKRKLTFFASQNEQEEVEMLRFANLSPLERLQEMRQCINLAYGMHGFDPDNLPTQHKLTFVFPPKPETKVG